MDDFTLIENLDKRGLLRRRWLGILLSLPAVGAASYMIFAGYKPPIWISAILFFVLWAGALNVMGSQQRVCVFLAFKGKAEEDNKTEKIDDIQLLEFIQRKAKNILFRTFMFAAVVTLITVW